jgi:hypothetical protein
MSGDIFMLMELAIDQRLAARWNEKSAMILHP